MNNNLHLEILNNNLTLITPLVKVKQRISTALESGSKFFLFIFGVRVIISYFICMYITIKLCAVVLV